MIAPIQQSSNAQGIRRIHTGPTSGPERRRDVVVRTLGGIAVAVGGETRTAGPSDATTRMLLAYLSVRRRAYLNTMSGLFFPHLGESAARAALVRALASIGAWLGVTVHYQADEAVVADSRLRSDVPAFEGAIRAGQYAHALMHYAGPFLAGAPVGLSDALRAWALAWRARMTELHLVASQRQAHLETADAVGVGVAFVDPAGQVLTANASFRRLCGGEEVRAELASAVRTRFDRRAAGDPCVTALDLDASWLAAMRIAAEDDVAVVQVRERTLEGEPIVMDGLGLTPAQQKVARGLAEGLANRAIARRLGVSEHTARRHTEQVFVKLGVNNRAAAAVRLLGSA